MTREEAILILKSILADWQRTAKDTDNVSCCLEYGFITYGKAKDCIKALEQEPSYSENPNNSTTNKNDLALIHTEGLDEEIRCIMCTNHMKSNRGCDGSCVVNKDMYKAVMDAIEKRIQPTTKNNLGVDVISREQAIDACHNFAIGVLDDYYEKCLKQWIIDLPSVTPQEPKWIPVSERLPEPNRLVLCYITTGATETYFLALRNEYYDDWEEGVGGSRLLGKDLGYEVIAWMPLPTPYEPQERSDRE